MAYRRWVFIASKAGIAINDHDHIKEGHTFKMRDRASGVARTEYTRTYPGVRAVQAFSEPDIEATAECVHKATYQEQRMEWRNDHDEITEESNWRLHTIRRAIPPRRIIWEIAAVTA